MADHSIYDEIRRVHDSMDARYKLKRSAAADIKKAKKMEEYLRAFKSVANQKKDQKNTVVGDLEDQAIRDITAQVGASLGMSSYKLFQNVHGGYKGKNYALAKSLGADDIFELELSRFLNAAIEEATKGQSSGDSQVLGRLPGNIAKGLLNQISRHGSNLVSGAASEIITKPTFKSGKVDVVSFSGNFTYSAEMLPYWKNFIQTFKGARFTVKNYSSFSKYETIHLGHTDITKTLLSSLSDIGFNQKEALHIFEHSLAYKNDPQVNQHLLHLRFAYELTGGGLRDEAGNKIDSADFFIYNDPSSNNIYVRSTKEMVANAMDYMGAVRDPLKSNIVILKNNF